VTSVSRDISTCSRQQLPAVRPVTVSRLGPSTPIPAVIQSADSATVNRMYTVCPSISYTQSINAKFVVTPLYDMSRVSLKLLVASLEFFS